jgi:hypothetical protein
MRAARLVVNLERAVKMVISVPAKYCDSGEVVIVYEHFLCRI